ncbi:protein-L-isoaspartate O-methyltransferase [Vibrio astriarenae]|nr:protein-L-isoaspartate O-methyltransferase [Vibrio sp. C7]
MSHPQADNLIAFLVANGIQDQAVLNAIYRLPRENFVSQAMVHQAYDNNALPIGQGQTISQPYIVARMTELLNLNHKSKVLEIGTGSGYQTAVLAQLVEHVFSVERIKALQWKQNDVSSNSTFTMSQPSMPMVGKAGRSRAV